MRELRLGCAGWSYDDWKGPFYPPGTPPGDMLSRYARVFSFVEVDGTHYRAPTRELCARWAAHTPDDFLFSVKLPGTITHDAKLRGVESALDAFVDALAPLRSAGKLAPVLAQFGPDFVREKDEDALLAFLDDARALPLAIELRHPSWWQPEVARALGERGAIFVWSVTQYGRTPPLRATSDVYLRFIGDRALTRFGHVQRENDAEIGHWARQLVESGAWAERVFIVANNHFLGFGPATTLRIADALGVPRPDLAAAARERGQRSLFG